MTKHTSNGTGLQKYKREAVKDTHLRFERIFQIAREVNAGLPSLHELVPRVSGGDCEGAVVMRQEGGGYLPAPDPHATISVRPAAFARKTKTPTGRRKHKDGEKEKKGGEKERELHGPTHTQEDENKGSTVSRPFPSGNWILQGRGVSRRESAVARTHKEGSRKERK